MNRLNVTELQKLAREVGTDLPKTMNPEAALSAASGDSSPKVVTFGKQKESMEKHIQKYYRRLKSQLPDCKGECSTHGCPDVVVSRCWLVFRDHIV